MAFRSTILSRVVVGRGVWPFPAWLERLFLMVDARRSRVDLGKLTDAQLADVGLTREQAECEQARGIFDTGDFGKR